MTLVVVDLESETRDVLGIYVRTEEDAVSYYDWETGELVWAPEDCVAVVPGYEPRMIVCPEHGRWTLIQPADGTTARRDCPECPARRGARIVNQFTGKDTGRRVAIPAGFSGSLCYSGTQGGRFGGFDGSGVHLTLNGRTTLCGRPVLDEPTVPRTIGPLSCEACYEADHAR